MDLSAFDDQCVRVTLKDGSVFEGACQYNCAEFNEAELGLDEDGLEIAHRLFLRSEIEKVEQIDENHPFLAPFGAIEEDTIREGIDLIGDVLISEEPRNAERLLRCLRHHLTQPDDDALPDRPALIAALEEALCFPANEPVFDLIRELLALLSK